MKPARVIEPERWQKPQPKPEPEAKPYRLPWRAVLIYLAIFTAIPGLLWMGVLMGRGMAVEEYRAGARDYKATMEAFIENVILSREQRRQMHTGGRSALEILRAKR